MKTICCAACLGFAALVSFATGPSFAQQAGSPRELHVVVQPEPTTLMLGLNQNGPTSMIAGNIYESLLRYDEKLNPQPSLAKSWEVSPDGREYVFYLQSG
jgi:peptide/nickel transport system substrate-binding protein